MRGRWEYASIWCLSVGTDAWVHMHAGDCGGMGVGVEKGVDM